MPPHSGLLWVMDGNGLVGSRAVPPAALATPSASNPAKCRHNRNAGKWCRGWFTRARDGPSESDAIPIEYFFGAI